MSLINTLQDSNSSSRVRISKAIMTHQKKKFIAKYNENSQKGQ